MQLPINDPGYLLHHLSTVLDRQSDELLQERFGIGFSQFKILMALKWHEGVQQKQIAESLGQTEASISRQINLMQKAGLLTSRTTPENRRRHVTKLTAKGNRLADKAFAVLNAYHAPVFSRIPPHKQAAFVEILRDMHQEACQPGRPGASQH